MAKIINLQDIKEEIRNNNGSKHITLCGGCFDIVHVGHIKFFENAKKNSDILVLLLESDKKVKNLKGKNRPFFSQNDRALVLSNLTIVDFIIKLPYLTDNSVYSKIIEELKPDTIAVTENDPLIQVKKAQTKVIGAKLKIVRYFGNQSSSKIARQIGLE